ncbi:hypothetical protein [Streptomyces scabrisporus]|uniref:hypothetical protein n=1 Tax=Embleya scabrispora TaxID=159449 RepID=UPI000360012E
MTPFGAVVQDAFTAKAGTDHGTPNGATRRAWRRCGRRALLGFPALAVPTGVADGLPSGVQLIGRRFREDLLLDAAAAIEARTPRARPTILST